MDKIKPLFTATATAIGGRNGHTQASDGSVSVDLSVPKAMGGPGKPGTLVKITGGGFHGQNGYARRGAGLPTAGATHVRPRLRPPYLALPG